MWPLSCQHHTRTLRSTLSRLGTETITSFIKTWPPQPKGLSLFPYNHYRQTSSPYSLNEAGCCKPINNSLHELKCHVLDRSIGFVMLVYRQLKSNAILARKTYSGLRLQAFRAINNSIIHETVNSKQHKHGIYVFNFPVLTK